MPVTVQDYTWSETVNKVVMTISLKGVKPSKADIFSSDDYVKVCRAHSTTAGIDYREALSIIYDHSH